MAEPVVRKQATRRAVRKTAPRKAPTYEASGEVSAERSYVKFIVIAVFVLIVGGSVAIGFSDSGQINITNTINNKKEYGTPEEKEQLQNIPVQPSRPALPDGGLVPTTAVNPNPPPGPATSEVASTTATTTSTTTESAATVSADAEGEPEATDTTEDESAPAAPEEGVAE